MLQLPVDPRIMHILVLFLVATYYKDRKKESFTRRRFSHVGSPWGTQRGEE